MKSTFILSSFVLFLTSFQVMSQDNSEPDKQRTINAKKLSLSQNYPNPFSNDESTTINYRAVGALDISLVFYSEDGKRVLLFEKLVEEAGHVVVHGKQLPPGIYTYALVVNGRMISKKKMEIVY